MESSATIKDIARELNVSVSTVSRALRGQPDVNADTRNAVLELAEKLDYQPNRVALSLLKKHTFTIGVLVPNLDYFFATAIKGIDEAALEAGYTVIVCQSNESYGKEVINLRRLVESRVDGLIISISSDTNFVDHFQKLIDKKMPVVFFDRDFQGLSAPKVLLDNFEGGYQATKHLIVQDCKRIAYLGGPKNLSISNERFDGYVEALKEAGMKIDKKLIINCDFNQEYAYVSTLELLKGKNIPDGIFAMSDRIAIGAMQAIKKLKLNIPTDIALVGFNNEPITKLLSPDVSSIDQPAFEMGKQAAKLFIELINNQNAPTNTIIRMKPNLEIRSSSNRKNMLHNTILV